MMNNVAYIYFCHRSLLLSRVRDDKLLAIHLSKMPGRSNAIANVVHDASYRCKKQVKRSTGFLNRGTRGPQPQRFLAMLRITTARNKP